MYFQFVGICKHCHNKMTFALSLDSQDFDRDLAYEIRCFECGQRIAAPDIERFNHLADTILFTNEQNNTADIIQVTLRQR